MPNSNLIYLDNNSTTPIDPRVLEEMMPFLTTNFANANSTHHFGVETSNAIKKARSQASNLIGAESNEIIFTSGATEAINLAIKGIAENYSNKGKHIITVSTEHSAVLDTCKYIETRGFEVTYLPVQKNGLIDIELFKSVLREDTILVSVMYVNNETGVIQPIKELSQLTHEMGSIFMTDATQAIGKIEIEVDELGIDLMCFSGHKMYAPKGIGLLYVRQRERGVKISALIHGGGHERSMRSGTLNVPSIVALGKACELAQQEMKPNEIKIRELRDYLETELLKIEGSFLNGDKENRILNTINICLPNFDANIFIGKHKNIAVSNGSACSSALFQPSHVLTAMRLSNNEAFGSIRISLGKFNDRQELSIFLKTIKEFF